MTASVDPLADFVPTKINYNLPEVKEEKKFKYLVLKTNYTAKLFHYTDELGEVLSAYPKVSLYFIFDDSYSGRKWEVDNEDERLFLYCKKENIEECTKFIKENQYDKGIVVFKFEEGKSMNDIFKFMDHYKYELDFIDYGALVNVTQKGEVCNIEYNGSEHFD